MIQKGFLTAPFFTLYCCVLPLLLLLLLFLAHQHKTAGRKTRLDIQNYGCNDNLLCDHVVVERNRISSLQSHGKALEKECCLPGIFCDRCDMLANLLCELNGHLMPCTSCFYGNVIIILALEVACPENQHCASCSPLTIHAQVDDIVVRC